MRFMTFVKCPENCAPPPQSFMEAMGKAREEASRAGTLLDTGGLFPISTSTRVQLYGGTVNVVDGPFTETKEVVGGYGIVAANSREEAVEGAVWLMNLHREHWPGWEGEAEVRQIMGEEDFGPANTQS